MLGLSSASHAAPEEIQVYLDDMRAPGQLGVDVHNNYVSSGRRTPDYPGEQAPGKVYRLTPEFAYGLTKTLELGVYVLSTRDASGNVHGDGVKARIKYVAPHDADQGFFYGLNLEVGKTSLRVAEDPWNAELKGILGWRSGKWLLALNPNLDGAIASHGGPVTADLDAKVSYAVDATTSVGVESYNELGPARRLQAWRQNGKSLFIVLDKDFGRFDLNAGIGRGLTDDADRWLVKFIVGTNFW